MNEITARANYKAQKKPLPEVDWEVGNQARMHILSGHAPYRILNMPLRTGSKHKLAWESG